MYMYTYMKTQRDIHRCPYAYAHVCMDANKKHGFNCIYTYIEKKYAKQVDTSMHRRVNVGMPMNNFMHVNMPLSLPTNIPIQLYIPMPVQQFIDMSASLHQHTYNVISLNAYT